MSSTKLFVLAALAVVSLTASVSAAKFRTTINGDTLEYEYKIYSESVGSLARESIEELIGNLRKAVESYLGAVTNPKFSTTSIAWKREGARFRNRIAGSRQSLELYSSSRIKDLTSQLEKAKAFFLNSLKKVASGESNLKDGRFSLEEVHHYAGLIERVISGNEQPNSQAMVDLATFKINDEPLENLIALYGSLLVKSGLEKAVDGLIAGVEAF